MVKRILKRGQAVTITNQTLSGKDFLEGTAILKSFISRTGDDFETWQVEFINEKGTYYTRNIKL